MAETPTILTALLAGLLSFLSPCVLPLFPSYLSYIAGVSVTEGVPTRANRRQALYHALAFSLGFSLIWVALGLGSSLLGSLFLGQKDLIRMIGGLFAMVMGLLMTGWVQIPFLMQERRFHFKDRPSGYLGSAAIGLAFAAGWTPCIGLTLAAVLALTASNPAAGIWPLFAFSIGFALPFLIGAYGLLSFRGLTRYTGFIAKVGGIFMLLMGFLLATNQLTRIFAFLIELFGYTTLL